MGTLAGSTALVTGAARRIGREIALALAGAGANVVIHYRRSAEEAGALAAELSRAGVRSWTVKADLAFPGAGDALVEMAVGLAGRLDILVNSASIFPADAVGDMTHEGLMGAITVNAWAPFCLGRAFASRVSRGSIVNLLDSHVTDAEPGWHAAYALSKHLLGLLTTMSALEFAPCISVNAVAPGLILPPEGKDERYLDELARTIPLRRHGAPSDVARAVLFLLESGFVTGQTIYVDGGRHLRRSLDLCAPLRAAGGGDSHG